MVERNLWNMGHALSLRIHIYGLALKSMLLRLFVIWSFYYQGKRRLNLRNAGG